MLLLYLFCYAAKRCWRNAFLNIFSNYKIYIVFCRCCLNKNSNNHYAIMVLAVANHEIYNGKCLGDCVGRVGGIVLGMIGECAV